MISQEESGLTSAQYAAIQSDQTQPTFQFIVEQHSPYWSSHSTGSAEDDQYFDVIDVDDEVWRAYYDDGSIVIERLPDEDGGDQSWASVTTISGVAEAAPSLVYDSSDDKVYIFYSDSSYDVWRESTSTGDRGTWDTSSKGQVGSFSSTSGLLVAAANPSALHVAQYRSDYNTRLHFFEAATPSTSEFEQESSNIYWPHAWDGIDVERVNNIDYIVFTSKFPADIGTKVEGSEVQTIAYSNYGIGVFKYRNDSWSDLGTVEKIDAYDAFRFRKYPKLSYVGNRFICSVALREGSTGHAHDAYGYYFSGDGDNWSHPHLAPDGNSVSTAKIVYPGGNYIYFVGSKYVQRSYITRLFNEEPHSSLQLDVSDKVVQYRDNTLVLKWEGNWYQNSILANDRIFRVYPYAGYYVSGLPARVPLGVLEVDSISSAKGVSGKTYSHSVSIRMRGLTANLTDRVKAPTTIENETQQVGYDQYNDTTGQDEGYGGLHHTAIQQGSFQSDEPTLTLVTNNKLGLAWSTTVVDAHNASIRSATGWPTIESDWPDTRFAGLIVRGYDRSNCYYAAYYPEDGTIKLVGISGGTSTVLDTASSIGTPSDSGGYIGLWVITHFSRIVVYYKTLSSYDPIGGGWTEAIEYIMPGAETSVEAIGSPDIDTVPLEKGYSGYAGYAYEPETEYPDYSFDIDSFTSSLLDFDYPWIDVDSYWTADWDYILGVEAEPDRIVLCTSDCKLCRTSDFPTLEALGGPTWDVITLSAASGTGYSFVVDARSPKYLGTGTKVNAHLCTTVGIYYIEDLFATAPTVTEQFTWQETGGMPNMDFSWAYEGWGVAVNHYARDDTNWGTWITYTTNGGKTWSTETIINSEVATYTGTIYDSPGLALSNTTYGTAYVTVFDSYKGLIYKTTDHGQSWALDTDFNITNTGDILSPNLHLPYDGEDELWYSYGTYYFGIVPLNIYKAEKGGSPVCKYTSGAPKVGRFAFYSYPTDKNYMVASICSSRFWGDVNTKTYLITSIDGGENWSEKWESASRDVNPPKIAMSGNNHDVVYIFGPTFGIAYSNDLLDSHDSRVGNLISLGVSYSNIIGIAGG